MLSFPDIAVLGGLALIVFGPERMPKIARQVGQFMGAMRSTSNAFIREMESAAQPPPYVPPAAPTSIEPPRAAEPIAHPAGAAVPAPDAPPAAPPTRPETP